jgi:hypothetical protein
MGCYNWAGCRLNKVLQKTGCYGLNRLCDIRIAGGIQVLRDVYSGIWRYAHVARLIWFIDKPIFEHLASILMVTGVVRL